MQVGVVQKAISDAYRKEAGLLSSEEIITGRKLLGITQTELARSMHVGVASIKRWEGTQIQTKSMDRALRQALKGNPYGDSYSGNKEFSIPRVKLVLHAFESILNTKLIKKIDKFLFAAKYLWYADMVHFRSEGEGITGAQYAALPYGPQLNNYSDLIDLIKNADVSHAIPLSNVELQSIRRVAATFSTEREIYEASHREVVWSEKAPGTAIPYTDALRLTEI